MTTTFGVRFISGLVAIAAGAFLGLSGGCGGDGGSGGSGTTGGNGGGGGAAEPTCQEYCDTVMKNCTMDNADYISADECLAVCATFPLGKTSDTSGNTVGCRTYHAGAAASNATTHCPHAGPGGAGYCGDNCEGFCTIALDACPKDYKDLAACKDACKGFADMEPFSINDVTGDTVQCRLYHASVATTDPTTHCPHVTVQSTPETCGVPTP